MPLITGLIRENCTLSAYVEKTGQDASGGSQVTLGTALATGISAFFGAPSGPRTGDFHSDNVRQRATMVSSSAYVSRTDVILKITAVSDTSLSGFVDTFWRVEAATNFPAGSIFIIPARHESSVSRYIVPA